jgi:hypothetical protein
MAVPVCNRHREHWQTFRTANRIALGLMLMFLAGLSLLLWYVLEPEPGRPNQTGLERVVTVVWLTALGALIPGIVLIAWVGRRPVRVVADTDGRLVLAGVAPAFARLWWERQRQAHALPSPDPHARFDVQPYRPDGVCPWPGTLYLLVWPLALGTVLGAVLGLAWEGLAALVQDWPRHDPRYLVLIALVCLGYVLAAAAPFPRSRAALRSRLVVLLLVPVLLVTGCAGLLRWFGVASFPTLLDLVLYGPALLFLLVLIYPLVRRNRVRRFAVAGLAGLLGPAALGGTALLLTDRWNDRHNALLYLCPLACLLTGWVGALTAREPFCTRCEQWMLKRPLGALRRPCVEVKAIVSQGEIARLAGEPVLPRAAAGDVALSLYFCEQCRESGRVVLELVDVTRGAKGGTSRRTVGRWVYPGTALGVVDQLFPPPGNEPAA